MKDILMKTRAPISIAVVVVAAVMLAAMSMLSGAIAQNGGSGPGSPTEATSAAGRDSGVSGAIEQKLLLSPAQRIAIYQEVSKDKTKVASKDFAPVVGTDVPPMIELYSLPDDAIAAVPEAKLYKYTMVENKVVVVDPIKMRVIDVISATSQTSP